MTLNGSKTDVGKVIFKILNLRQKHWDGEHLMLKAFIFNLVYNSRLFPRLQNPCVVCDSRALSWTNLRQ